ncbi:MAG TPA: hypothetical protein VHG72_19860 [Polyangia bacterium]|nr:hypothetical protein [Polyangia bacterium]
MSSHDSHSDHGGHQSEDQIDFAKVIAVGVVSLIVFTLGTLWAVAIFHRQTARSRAAAGEAAQPQLGRGEIGIVDQVLFEGDHRLATWRAERAALLNGYGWIDRSKGIVHVPIERAMEQVLAGTLPEGAPK